MRFIWLVGVLGCAVLVPFVIWGPDFGRLFSGEAARNWVEAWGAWGWLAVILLLSADLIFPIPATAVMSAAGYLYGPLLGGAISALGSVVAGLLAYVLCRTLGRPIARRLTGEAELKRAEEVFASKGAWAVVLSRWMPLLPEVVACLAGLTKMRFPLFFFALACGSVPMGFGYAAIGAEGQRRPDLALVLSIFIPPLLWTAIQVYRKPKSRR